MGFVALQLDEATHGDQADHSVEMTQLALLDTVTVGGAEGVAAEGATLIALDPEVDVEIVTDGLTDSITEIARDREGVVDSEGLNVAETEDAADIVKLGDSVREDKKDGVTDSVDVSDALSDNERVAVVAALWAKLVNVP